MTVGWIRAAIARVGAQAATDHAHPNEMIAAQMSGAVATARLGWKVKNIAKTASAAMYEKSVVVSETAAADAMATEIATAQAANLAVKAANLATATDVSAALETMADAMNVEAVEVGQGLQKIGSE